MRGRYRQRTRTVDLSALGLLPEEIFIDETLPHDGAVHEPTLYICAKVVTKEQKKDESWKTDDGDADLYLETLGRPLDELERAALERFHDARRSR